MKPVTVHIWHRWWVIGWVILLAVTVLSVLWLPWWLWILAMLVVFLAPELYAIAREPSATPPLTSILRRYVPSYLAFPLLAGLVGFCTTAALTDRAWLSIAVGVPAGVAGWGIEHFTTTYFRLERKSRR